MAYKDGVLYQSLKLCKIFSGSSSYAKIEVNPPDLIIIFVWTLNPGEIEIYDETEPDSYKNRNSGKWLQIQKMIKVDMLILYVNSNLKTLHNKG